jgi:hypothetical protein
MHKRSIPKVAMNNKQVAAPLRNVETPESNLSKKWLEA